METAQKFFHDSIKRNNKRNLILVITKRDGLTTSNSEEIVAEFVHFYKGLLGTTVARKDSIDFEMVKGPVVPHDKRLGLVDQVTVEEIKNALNDIDDDRAPGPHGFGSMFFKRAWDVVGDDVVVATLEFFRTGRLLKQWNHAFIALVPKSAHVSSVSEYRPISCCTVFYKITSKILAGDVVDEAQNAFIILIMRSLELALIFPHKLFEFPNK